MANAAIFSDLVSKYLLPDFVNNIQFLKHANREFEGMFSDTQYISGQTVNVLLPNRFTPGFGSTVTPQGVQDRTTPLTIEEQIHVGMSFTSSELTTDFRTSGVNLSIRDKYTRPASLDIANSADTYAISKLKTINNFVGTAGTLVNSIDIVNNANANLTARGVPLHDRYCGVNIQTGASIKNSMKSNFTPNINEGVVKTGFIANIYGTEFFETQNLGYHTSGLGNETAAVGGLIPCGTVKTAVSTGNTIVLQGLQNNTVGVVKAGDIIQMQVTQSVNFRTKAPTGSLMSFSVLADANSGPTGECTITVSPSIVTTGNYKNVSGIIGVGEAVKLVASHNVGYLLQKSALTVAMPKLKPLGAGTTSTAMTFDKEYSIGMRYSEGSLILTDENVQRLDILIGALCLADYGVRIVG